MIHNKKQGVEGLNSNPYTMALNKHLNHRLKTNISLGHRGLLGDLDIYLQAQIGLAHLRVIKQATKAINHDLV